jgi:hypothetical protein
VELISDGEILNNVDFSQVANKYFNMQSTRLVAPIDGEKTLKVVRDSQATALVFFTEKNKEQLAAFVKEHKAIEPHMKQLQEEKNVIVSVIEENQRPLIVVKLNESADLDKALAKLSSEVKIKTEMPVIPY